MVFSSPTFLGLFLPLFLIVYYILPGLKAKNFALVAFSLVFYAWGEPVWVVLLVISGLVDYVNGLIISRCVKKSHKRAALLSSLIINLGILCGFKYSGFILLNINTLFNSSLPVLSFALPLGISFYTFQTLSYTIDVYRGEIEAQKSFIAFLAYVTMFPQLVAGPIVRYADIEKNVYKREMTLAGFSAGISRFAIGLSKKVLLANSAGSVASFLLDGNLSGLSMLSAWLGIIMFSFQIYFDFSGYSDMAIGMGKMIGFDFQENFNYPYTSKSITDFWRRWHVSLSTFFRDYVYIPLGGNKRKVFRNILLVWFLTGLWHGASWNFIIWGLYFGVIILLEKYYIAGILAKLPKALNHAYSLLLITFGWIIFYFTDFSRLAGFFAKIFDFSHFYDYTFYSSFMSNIFLIIVMVFACTPYPARAAKKLLASHSAVNYLQPCLNAVSIFVCFIILLGDTYNPFLYFRF